MNDEIKRLSQLKKRIEEAIDGGSTEIPKWLEESEEFQALLRDVEVGFFNAGSSYRRQLGKDLCHSAAMLSLRRIKSFVFARLALH